VKDKFLSIVTQKGIKENSDYDDMAGPLLVVIIFGLLLTLVSIIIIVILHNRKEKFNLDIFMDLV